MGLSVIPFQQNEPQAETAPGDQASAVTNPAAPAAPENTSGGNGAAAEPSAQNPGDVPAGGQPVGLTPEQLQALISAVRPQETSPAQAQQEDAAETWIRDMVGDQVTQEESRLRQQHKELDEGKLREYLSHFRTQLTASARMQYKYGMQMQIHQRAEALEMSLSGVPEWDTMSPDEQRAYVPMLYRALDQHISLPQARQAVLKELRQRAEPVMNLRSENEMLKRQLAELQARAANGAPPGQQPNPNNRGATAAVPGVRQVPAQPAGSSIFDIKSIGEQLREKRERLERTPPPLPFRE